MKNNIFLIPALGVVVIAPFFFSFVQAATGSAYDEPNSYEAATGIIDPEYTTQLPDLKPGDYNNKNEKGLMRFPLLDSPTHGSVNAPPPGNIYLKSKTTSDGDTECVFADSTEQAIFDETFTTASATSYIEINYSGQVQIPSGSTSNGLYLKCTVTQGAVTAPCASSHSKFAIVRRPKIGTNQYVGITSFGSYIGYVSGVSPSTSTNVKISALTDPGGTAAVCFSNLILRY